MRFSILLLQALSLVHYFINIFTTIVKIKKVVQRNQLFLPKKTILVFNAGHLIKYVTIISIIQIVS